MEFVKWFQAQRDRVGGWGCVVVGGVMVISGWLSISATSVVSHQLPYLASGGIGGLFFLGAGFGLLIRADLHDEWRKLDRLESALSGTPLQDTQELRMATWNTGPAGDEIRLDDHKPSAATGSRPEPVGRALMSSKSSQRTHDRYTTTGALALETPITARQETIALVGLLAGGALVALSWLRVSATSEIQLGLDNLALAVAGVLAVGAVVAHHSRWVRRRIGTRIGFLFSGVATDEADERTSAGPDDGGWYRVEGSRRYHHQGCPVLKGQRRTARMASSADLAALSPCRLCDAG
jgi:hypothetical protein